MKKGVSSLGFRKWGRHGLDGLSRGRGEKKKGGGHSGAGGKLRKIREKRDKALERKA